jgi:hypothetical protein
MNRSIELRRVSFGSKLSENLTMRYLPDAALRVGAKF